MRSNILLVGVLIIIAGVIVMMSFLMKPMPTDTKVQQQAVADAKLTELPAPETVAQAPAESTPPVAPSEVTQPIPPPPPAPVPPTPAQPAIVPPPPPPVP